jgi:hypothetical protein
MLVMAPSFAVATKPKPDVGTPAELRTCVAAVCLNATHRELVFIQTEALALAAPFNILKH